MPLLEILRKPSGGVKDREDGDRIDMQAVDDPIIAVEDFAQILLLKFGYDAAGEREGGEAVDGRDQVGDEEVGIVRGIARDERVDGLEVVARGGGPRQGSR